MLLFDMSISSNFSSIISPTRDIHEKLTKSTFPIRILNTKSAWRLPKNNDGKLSSAYTQEFHLTLFPPDKDTFYHPNLNNIVDNIRSLRK